VAKVNTNLIVLDLGSLAQENFGLLEVNQLESAPPECSSCSAVLYDSQICRFCLSSNSVPDSSLGIRRPVEEWVRVKAAATETELLPAVDPRNATGEYVDLDDTGVTVFCIDVSGSSTLLVLLLAVR
jgi:hypothetical protein